MSAAESAVQPPSHIKDPIPYRLLSSSESLQASTGRLFHGGRYAWLLNRNGCVYVFNSTNGECTAQLRLAPRGSSVAVSCSCELSSEARLTSATKAKETSLLVLALHVEGSREKKTVLVVVDPAASKLLRAVEVPWEVSSLCGVSGGRLQLTAGLFSPSLVQSFSGVLAVGCTGGHVLLVDLALGIELPVKASVKHPHSLAFIDAVQNGAGSGCVSTARNNGKHSCIDVLAYCHKKGQFLYTTTSQAVTHRFPVDSLAITALHFVPQVLCLLIGYSLGGFQLYDVQKMAILHSSPCPKVPSPVTHFVYQEPENDPKNNVYVWVARGNPAFVSLDVETKLTLYQVLFAQKISNEVGTIYQNFQSCGAGFLYPLTPTPTRPHSSRSLSSSLLSCRTVEMRRGGRGLDESHDETAHGPDLTVAAFVWGCGDSAHRDYMVGVFDLNQYYHSQVPKTLHWRSSGKHTSALGCSYFTFYSLKSMTEKSTLLDAAVMDFSPFVSLPPVPEIHLWPTSLSFNVTAITSEGFHKCSCLGLQKTALEKLRLGGVAMFSCPQGIFSMCERAELLGPTWDLDHSSIEVQQKALLSVALDHRMTSVLTSCAHTWMEGGSNGSFSVFVDWLRSKLDEMRREKDGICHQLFGGAADNVDKSTPLLLNHLRLKFHHLSGLLTSLLTPLTTSPISSLTTLDPLITELSQFYVTATTCHIVTQVVIWCLRNGLLPVTTERYGRYFFYPATALTKLYDRLRNETSPCKLSVDHLCEELQSDYHYPADSLEGVLAVFTSTNSLAQHCLMMFFLCDIANLKGYSFDQDSLLASYSVEFNLSKKLVALVTGLWALDHFHYQVALRNLIGRQMGCVQWFPWQHCVVVSLLLKASDSRLALTYTDAYENSVNDPKLLLHVYIRRQCVWDAIRLLRPYEDSEDIDELFGYFLDLCFEYKCLNKLVNISLNEFEDAFFCYYLESSPSLKAQELLVMHCITHHRYNDAISIQEKIRPLAMADPDERVRERSEFRDCMLERFSRCVPSVVTELRRASQDKPIPSGPKIATKAKNPPLSAVLARNEAKSKVKSSVEVIYQAMKQIEEARDVPIDAVSPFRKKVECTVPHTPFFSPPPSVRKAMSSRRRGCSVVRATPIIRRDSPDHVPTPNLQTPGSTSGLSFLRTHMDRFRERMFQLSQTTSIDPSFITTPTVAKPTETSTVRQDPLPLPPPSILKVKELRSDMETGGTGKTGTPATLTRRIRFAEESGVSPTSSLSSSQSVKSGSTPYTTCIVSPLTPITAASIAVEMPLPSSDDSDLFYSFTDSPTIPPPPPPNVTQLTPSHPPQTTPTQSPLPKTQLFVGADNDYEDEQDSKQQQQNDRKQQQDDGKQDMEVESDQSDRPQLSHDLETVMETEKQTVAKVTVTPQKIHFHDTRSLLTRERIGFRPSPIPPQVGMESRHKTTPTNMGGGGGGLFAPHRPSPLSHSITSQDPPRNSPRNPTMTSRTPSGGGPQKNIFSPMMASELVGTKKGKLSLESVRKKTINDITSPTKDPKPLPLSAMMVQVVPKDEEVERGEKETEIGVHTYRFSPGKIVSTPPPVEELRDPSPTYVFSPPLTRSAARRRAAAMAGKTTASDTTTVLPGVTTTSAGKERPTASTTTTDKPMKLSARPRAGAVTVPRPPVEYIDLVSPPSQQATPTTNERGTRRGQRSQQQVTRTIATRKSTRLLQERRKF